MAITAMFITTEGTKTWEVSQSKVLPVGDMSTGFELEAEKNSAVEGSPLSNLRGQKKVSLSFPTTLVSGLGYDVREEYESWQPFIGLSGVIRFGSKRFRQHSFLLTAAKASAIKLDDAGRWRSCKLTFTFEQSDDTSADAIEAAIQTVDETQSAAKVTAPTELKAVKKPQNVQLQKSPVIPASQLTKLPRLILP